MAEPRFDSAKHLMEIINKGLDDQSFFNDYFNSQDVKNVLGSTKVVITGGPSAGKSTLLNTIGEQIDGVYRVPEVASLLLGGGFPSPTEVHPWNEPWQVDFQRSVASVQISMEDIAIRRATTERKGTVVYDRGLLDGAAYLPGGVPELEEITGIDEELMLKRYDAVLHLTSSAAHGKYDKLSNPYRFEEADVARRLEERTLEAWGNHDCCLVIDDPEKQIRVAQGLRIIGGLTFPRDTKN